MFDNLRMPVRVNYDLIRARGKSLFKPSSGSSPVVLNTLPKAGTHLAIKLLQQLPGMSQVRLLLSQASNVQYPVRGHEDAVPLGVVWPLPASRVKVTRTIRRLPPGAFISGHVPHDPTLLALLAELGVRMVVLVRDPRDVAVSGARYIGGSTSHPLHARLSAMTPSERLMAAIVGMEPDARGFGMKDLRQQVVSVTNWDQLPLAHAVRYEELVGPLGGGTVEAQHAAIAKVAEHVGVSVTETQVEEIGLGLYGGTPTFRKGTTGSWREHFGPEHLEAAGPLIEDLLVDLGYEDDMSWWR